MSRRRCCCCPPDCSKLQDSYVLSGVARGGDFFKVETLYSFNGSPRWTVDEALCAHISAAQGGMILGPVILDKTDAPDGCVWEYSTSTNGGFLDAQYRDYDSLSGPPADICALAQGSRMTDTAFTAQLSYTLEFICSSGTAEWRLTAELKVETWNGSGSAGVTCVLSSGQFKVSSSNIPPPFFTTITTTAPCGACQSIEVSDWSIT